MKPQDTYNSEQIRAALDALETLVLTHYQRPQCNWPDHENIEMHFARLRHMLNSLVMFTRAAIRVGVDAMEGED